MRMHRAHTTMGNTNTKGREILAPSLMSGLILFECVDLHDLSTETESYLTYVLPFFALVFRKFRAESSTALYMSDDSFKVVGSIFSLHFLR
jgi:hypothetical protein